MIKYGTELYRLVVTVAFAIVITLSIITFSKEARLLEETKKLNEQIDELKMLIETTRNESVKVDIVSIPATPTPEPTPIVEDEPEVIPEASIEKEPATLLNEGYWVTNDHKSIELTDDDIYYLAWITQAEAEEEPEIGQRLVIDVILNRIDSSEFPNTVYGVIFDGKQFSPTFDGRLNSVKPTERLKELAREEAEDRMNSEVLYFRTKHYHTFGTQLFQYGGHYFSK